MARAHYPGRHEAEHRFPHRVDVPVPPFGLGGRLNEMLAWYREKVAAGARAGAQATLREVLTSPEVPTISNPLQRDRVLRIVALAQSSMGDVQAALPTAERIEEPGKRAEALADIAAGRSPFRK
jgi:hypothetical protein